MGWGGGERYKKEGPGPEEDEEINSVCDDRLLSMLLDPQVKSTGYPRASWSPTEAELHTTITHTIDKAAGQLSSGRDTVHYIMPDLHLQQVTLVVALPYVTRAQLMKVGVVSADILFICVCNGPRAMQRRERQKKKFNMQSDYS